jgi:hypothetical protein
MAQKKHMRIWQIVLLGAMAACASFVTSVCVAKMVGSQVELEAEARQIAKWAVAITGCSDNGVDLVAGGDIKNCSLNVANNSEVVSSYVIEVSNIPNGVKVGLGTSGTLLTPQNGVVRFTDTGGALAMNDNREHVLRFGADLATNAINENEITVGVLFVQEEPR